MVVPGERTAESRLYTYLGGDAGAEYRGFAMCAKQQIQLRARECGVPELDNHNVVLRGHDQVRLGTPSLSFTCPLTGGAHRVIRSVRGADASGSRDSTGLNCFDRLRPPVASVLSRLHCP